MSKEIKKIIYDPMGITYEVGEMPDEFWQSADDWKVHRFEIDRELKRCEVYIESLGREVDEHGSEYYSKKIKSWKSFPLKNVVLVYDYDETLTKHSERSSE